MSCFSTRSSGTFDVQTQVDSFKDIEYLPTSAIQDKIPRTFEIGKDERFTDLYELVIKTVVEIQGEMELLCLESNLLMLRLLVH